MGGQGHLVPLQVRMSVLLKSIITLWRLGEGSLLWPAQKDFLLWLYSPAGTVLRNN